MGGNQTTYISPPSHSHNNLSFFTVIAHHRVKFTLIVRGLLIFSLDFSEYTIVIAAAMSDSDPKKKCCGTDCDNEAGTLQCPTCLKLGVKGSYFCSQDCFKKNWVGRIRADALSLSN
jgi:hypothetical protein